MKEVISSITISKPVDELFAFVIDPKNTPKWVEPILVEETNEWPVKAGSIYCNQRKSGEWSEYEVVAFELNKTFKLRKDDGLYVEYEFAPVGEDVAMLEYCLRMDKGEIASSLNRQVLEDLLNKLKEVIESRRLES